MKLYPQLPFTNHIPVHVQVKKTQKITPTTVLVTIELPILSIQPSPGQFYMVWKPGYEEIPLAPSGLQKDGKMEFTIQAIGPTTTALTNLTIGEFIGLRGPYGNGYHVDINPRGKEVLIVGGGNGVAPLQYLADVLHGSQAIVDVLIGARTKNELLFPDRFQKIVRNIGLATDDGTQGYHGYITDLLREKISSRPNYATIVACGPEAMLAEVVNILSSTAYHYQISLHRIMKCGIGVCGNCAIQGIITCREGPVILRNRINLITKELGSYTRKHDGSKQYL